MEKLGFMRIGAGCGAVEGGLVLLIRLTPSAYCVKGQTGALLADFLLDYKLRTSSFACLAADRKVH